MEGIPEEPGDGYRPEFYTPRVAERPVSDGIPRGTWLEAQYWTAVLFHRVQRAGAKVGELTGTTSPLAMPSAWIGTRLLLEAHSLAVYLVTSVACDVATFDAAGGSGIPERLDAINGVTGVDAPALLHAVARLQVEAHERRDRAAVEECAAKLAYLAAEFGRCAAVFIHQSPPPQPNHSPPVYFDTLTAALPPASVGMFLRDPAAARLFDVLTSAMADMQAGRLPLQGLTLPVQVFHGHGSPARGLQAHTESIEDHVLRSLAAQYDRRGAAGGALLRVAWATGATAPCPAALVASWNDASNDPFPTPVTAEHARRLALRAVAALGLDVSALLAAARKATTRANRAGEFRALDVEGQRRRVRTLLRSKGSTAAAARYLSVTLDEVQALAATKTAPAKRRPKAG